MIRPLFAALLALGGHALAQEIDGSDKVVVAARFVPAEAAADSEVELEVTATIEPGYHIYGSAESMGLPTKLGLAELGGLSAVGPARIPAGVRHETEGIVGHWIEGSAVLRQRLAIPATMSPGSVEVVGKVDYMACTPQFCDPPASAPFRATLKVRAAAPTITPTSPDGRPLMDLFGDDQKATANARFVPSTARPGEAVRLVVDVTVVPGWHVYGARDENPTRLEVADTAGLRTHGAVVLPDGERHAITDTIVNWWLSGSFEIEQTMVVPSELEPGERLVRAAVVYLPCDESRCLNESRAEVEARLVVEAGPVRREHAPAAIAAAADGPKPGGFGGLWGLVLAAIGAGLLALVMPCTYPMIPITFSFFTKQADQRGGRVLPLALTYGAGIVGIFIVLGIAAGPVIIPFATHWITNLVIAAAFLLFALALFGLITLQPPRFLMDLTGRAHTASGYAGVFLMGATLVVASFTCTVPFVGTMLAISAEGGLGHVVLGMAVFGLTMALPFVYLSLLPGKLKALPKSGEWMEVLKVFLGFIELAAALKFISNVDLKLETEALPRELFLMLWTAIFLVAGLFLLGTFRLRDASSSEIGAGRMTGGIATMMFAFYCLFGALGFRLDFVMTAMAPNYSAPMVVGVSGRLGGDRPEQPALVVDDHEAAVERARRERKLLMVNFTGKL
jgi:thiol:disulfide interchange protein DsbD